jgi:flagellar protein FlgJ
MGLVPTSGLSTPTSSVDGGYDPRGLDAVKLAAKNNDPASTKKVAQQFESMFLSMMLKNMRATLPGTDPLASDGTKMATDMYDQQLVQNLSKGKGMGLADALVAQIERAQGKQPSASTGASGGALDQFSNGVPLTMTRAKAMSLMRDGTSIDTSTTGATGATGASAQQTPSTGSVHHDFVDRFKDAAMAAAEATGLPAKVILGQAALESGWGRHEVRDAKGGGSFNLFGIKAPAGWTGPTVDAVTTEVVNGVAQKVVQKFKAYASYADSFIDYAKTVANNPRYEKAMQVAGDVVKFASEMGKSGYATDPNYGTKLAQVLTGPLSKLL